MKPEILERLAEFERQHKPDSSRYLAIYREEIVALHFKGYSLKTTFAYLKEAGVGCSLRTFERWVKDNIDFAQETSPLSTSASRQAPAPAAAGAPKSPVLVDSKAAGGLDSINREAALSKARERREKGFKNPVERALEGSA
jgi:hypothetical protein